MIEQHIGFKANKLKAQKKDLKQTHYEVKSK